MKKEILILLVVIIAAAIMYFTVFKEDSTDTSKNESSDGSQVAPLSEGDEKFVKAVRGWYHGWVKTAYPNDLTDQKIKHSVWQLWVHDPIKENIKNMQTQYGITIKSYDDLANYTLKLKSYII